MDVTPTRPRSNPGDVNRRAVLISASQQASYQQRLVSPQSVLSCALPLPPSGRSRRGPRDPAEPPDSPCGRKYVHGLMRRHGGRFRLKLASDDPTPPEYGSGCVLASIPVTDPRALARDDERERGSRLPLRCEGSRLRPFAERADDYRPGRTGTLAPLRRHTRATRSGLEGTRRFGRDPSYHVPNNRTWRSLLRAHSWAWRSVRCYCSSGECESEPGAQEDSRTSSATGASPTGTRALARGLKRARGALLSARSEAAAAAAGMLLSR